MDNKTQQLASLAKLQHGVFSRPQAFDLGFSKSQIRTRIRRGEWKLLHRGIYQLGLAPLSFQGRLVAASLALPSSVVSHEAAAWLHRFPQFQRNVAAVVCVGPHGTSNSKLARIHRYDGVEHEDLWTVDNIQVTSPALTLFHLSGVLDPTFFRDVLDDALASKRVQIGELYALGEYWTRKGRPRRRVMRALLESRGSGYVAPESQLERVFIDLVEAAALPQPKRQASLPWDPGSSQRVDFLFERAGVLVEVDGRRWHTRTKDFEADRKRDRAAQLHGLLALRFTWDEVKHRPESVIAELRTAIARARAA